MFVIDDTLFLAQLEILSEAQMEFVPDGMSQEELELMLQVLQAKEPEDIREISTEAILGMFQHINKITPLLRDNSPFADDENTPGPFENSIIQLPSAHSRRVL